MVRSSKNKIGVLGWLNALSIDVVVLAICWQGVMAISFGMKTTWVHIAVLGLSIWLAYFLDRWLDARKVKGSLRHRITRKRPGFNILVIGIVLSVDLALAFTFIDKMHLLGGFVLLGLSSIYAWKIARGPSLPAVKELSLSFIFSGGCVLFTLPVDKLPSLGQCLGFLVFFLLCFASTSLIAHYDRERDLEDGQASIATELPESYHPLRYLALLTGVLGFMVLPPQIGLTSIGAGIGLFCVHYLRKWLSRESLRLSCDLLLIVSAATVLVLV